MKRILIVNTNFYDFTGIVTFIRNYCYPLKQEDINVEYVVFGLHPVFRDELNKLGLKFYEIPDKKKQPTGYYKALNKIMKKGYDVVHVHGNSAMMSFEMFLAKLHKIPKRIAHAHNTTCDHMILNKILQPLLKNSTNVRIACSEDAAKWCFPETQCHIINNAIETNAFSYNEIYRNSIRKEVGLSDDVFVMGHVGYFNEQKNHDYLIDVFTEVYRRNKKSALLLVGKGDLEDKIDEKIKRNGIENAVYKLGQRSDVNKIMCAMDCFVFPSKWEGLGIVLIEAQCNGLTCCISDCIPLEATMRNENVNRLSLNLNPSDWADAIDKIKNNKTDRSAVSGLIKEIIIQKGFSIDNEREKLKKIYIE